MAEYPGRPLHVGSRGDAVAALQRQLNSYGGEQLAVDGEYGPQTARKVEAWQRRRGLGTDGAVDAVIWNAIFREPPPALHLPRRETPLDRLRQLQAEQIARWRLRRRLPPGQQKDEVVARERRGTAALQQLLRRLASAGRPRRIGPDTVRGGRPGRRLVFAAELALQLYQEGKRPSFYSESGAWTVAFALTGEPAGYRSDCSQWVTSLFHTCGLPDPNDGGYVSGGYTGTLADHGREVTRAEAERAVAVGELPTLVIWDPWGPAGHVEVLVSPAGDTIGHGSPPINAHTIDTFDYKPGGPRFYVYDQP